MPRTSREIVSPPPLGEAGWRRLVEQVKDYAIFMLDTAGRNASWNEGVERVLGFTDLAAVLATAIRMVAPNITDDHRAAARAALKRGLSED